MVENALYLSQGGQSPQLLATVGDELFVDATPAGAWMQNSDGGLRLRPLDGGAPIDFVMPGLNPFAQPTRTMGTALILLRPTTVNGAEWEAINTDGGRFTMALPSLPRTSPTSVLVWGDGGVLALTEERVVFPGDWGTTRVFLYPATWVISGDGGTDAGAFDADAGDVDAGSDAGADAGEVDAGADLDAGAGGEPTIDGNDYSVGCGCSSSLSSRALMLPGLALLRRRSPPAVKRGGVS